MPNMQTMPIVHTMPFLTATQCQICTQCHLCSTFGIRWLHIWHCMGAQLALGRFKILEGILSHIWWMKKQIWGAKFPKKAHQKKKKWENAQKQPILGMFWCIWATKSVSPDFRRSCQVVFVHLLLIKMVWMLKSREISFFVSKMLIFHQITNFFWQKCTRNKNQDMKWIEIAFKCCTFTLISSLERKRSNVQSKIWNCPPHPLF